MKTLDLSYSCNLTRLSLARKVVVLPFQIFGKIVGNFSGIVNRTKNILYKSIEKQYKTASRKLRGRFKIVPIGTCLSTSIHDFPFFFINQPLIYNLRGRFPCGKDCNCKGSTNPNSHPNSGTFGIEKMELKWLILRNFSKLV